MAKWTSAARRHPRGSPEIFQGDGMRSCYPGTWSPVASRWETVGFALWAGEKQQMLAELTRDSEQPPYQKKNYQEKVLCGK
jgi:hypothetical protein